MNSLLSLNSSHDARASAVGYLWAPGGNSAQFYEDAALEARIADCSAAARKLGLTLHGFTIHTGPSDDASDRTTQLRELLTDLVAHHIDAVIVRTAADLAPTPARAQRTAAVFQRNGIAVIFAKPVTPGGPHQPEQEGTS